VAEFMKSKLLLLSLWRREICFLQRRLLHNAHAYSIAPATVVNTFHTQFWNHQQLLCCTVYNCFHLMQFSCLAFQGLLNLETEESSRE
jgi:hypothetical protein